MIRPERDAPAVHYSAYEPPLTVAHTGLVLDAALLAAILVTIVIAPVRFSNNVEYIIG